MKRFVFGAVAVAIVVAGLVAWPLIGRRIAMARAGEAHRQFLQKMIAQRKNSPSWSQAVAEFNKGTLTSRPIFEHATRVEAFTLIGNPVATTTRNFGDVQGFAATNKITVSDPTFAHDLGAVLLDGNTYLSPGADTKLCMMDPGVAFRVWSGAKFVDCIICFHCNQLGVVENDPRAPVRQIGGALGGRMNVLGDFDPAREQLLALTQRAFPDDGELQALR